MYVRNLKLEHLNVYDLISGHRFPHRILLEMIDWDIMVWICKSINLQRLIAICCKIQVYIYCSVLTSIGAYYYFIYFIYVYIAMFNDNQRMSNEYVKHLDWRWLDTKGYFHVYMIQHEQYIWRRRYNKKASNILIHTDMGSIKSLDPHRDVNSVGVQWRWWVLAFQVHDLISGSNVFY